MHSKQSILFILNDFGLGGANKVLFGFAEWLHTNKGYALIFGSMVDGLMRDEFSKLGIAKIFRFDKQPLFSRIARKLYAAKGGVIHKLSTSDINFLKQNNIVLLYANTIHNEKLSNSIRKEINLPLIVHAHEQPYIMRLFYSAALQNHLTGASAIIIVSGTSGEGLRNVFGVDDEKMHHVYPAIKLPARSNSLVTKNYIRLELGIPADAFVVLGMGNPHWIKGVDLFILTAQKVVKANSSVHFVWVGGNDQNEYLNDLKKDVQYMGLIKNIHFVSSVMNPDVYFSISNIFFLSSRVDTFPLVTLEASQFSLPVVCFQNAGGITEIIDNNCGSVIDYNNLVRVSETILGYANDVYSVETKGKNFKSKASQNINHENMCHKLGNLVDSLIF